MCTQRQWRAPPPLSLLPGQAPGLDVAKVWLKLERIKVGGSFNARGMFTRMPAQAIPPSGVVIATATRVMPCPSAVMGLHC
jgi:hypothetical protein